MRRLGESLTLAGLMLWPFGGVRTLYRSLGPEDSFGRRTRYMNLGYWGAGARDLDEAGDAMAELMARTADLGEDDVVLDVGCGFGDQDRYWAERCAKVVALNISEAQLAVARERHGEVVEFRHGDATALDLESSSVDVVFGLESAFHFQPRAAFLREALRVLKPGGRLVLVDLCGVERKLGLADRLGQLSARLVWRIPAANLLPPSGYGRLVHAVGFVEVQVESLYEQVHPPFKDYIKDQLELPEIRAKMTPFYAWMLRSSLAVQARAKRPPPLDYVLVHATRPLVPRRSS